MQRGEIAWMPLGREARAERSQHFIGTAQAARRAYGHDIAIVYYTHGVFG
jgi:hypothetical protein